MLIDLFRSIFPPNRRRRDMPSLLSRRQIRFLGYCTVLFIQYVVYTSIFRTENLPMVAGPAPSASPAYLLAQRGNEDYLRWNINNSVASRRGKYKWQAIKRAVGRTGDDKFGKLNVHIWDEICGDDLRSLRYHVLFPRYPSRRLYTPTTGFSHGKGSRDFGERIFGFLHPTKSGVYNFIVMQGPSLEVWLSTNADPHLAKLVAKWGSSASNEDRYGRFDVEMIAAEKYYVEILHKKGLRDCGFYLRWKRPGSHGYVELTGRDISVAVHDAHLESGQVDSDEPVEKIQPIHAVESFLAYDEGEQVRAHLHRLPVVGDGFLANVLPSCEYRPSYLAKDVVEDYRGVWLTHYNSLYPSDKTNVTRNGWISLGNDVLEKREALQVVRLFLRALDEAKTRKYKLKRIISVEKNHDSIKGDRYLLELELENVLVPEKSFRLSNYVYKQKGSESLCIPEGYQWKKNATVNIVLTVGGRQAKWVQHFINNVAEIYRETKDRNLNVVIMDFHSKDIDIKASLERSGLPRYMLLHMKSKFHKTVGLQYAMKFVTNPNDIVFVCDLHLYLPVNIVDHIRKHCIQGKTAFNPVVARLDCGATPKYANGQWEYLGYGPMATFKSDWDRVGGMNVERFRHSWGGEDWDMLDRLLSAGYEVERLKILNFFHFYHTKKGMWKESE